MIISFTVVGCLFLVFGYLSVACFRKAERDGDGGFGAATMMYIFAFLAVLSLIAEIVIGWIARAHR